MPVKKEIPEKKETPGLLVFLEQKVIQAIKATSGPLEQKAIKAI